MNEPTQYARVSHLHTQLFSGLGEMHAGGVGEATVWQWIVGMVNAIVALTMPEAVTEEA